MQNERTENKSSAATKGKKKTGLGRGLDALFPNLSNLNDSPLEHSEIENKEFLNCDISLISPNRYQPRNQFSKDELEELSSSIKKQGVLQPLLVRKSDTGYELIAGERRLRAAKMAELSEVPVIIKEVSDRELLEFSIIENVQRENLNPMEEAEAYQRLIDEFNLTQDTIANCVGKSRSAVANFLRLNQLPEMIKRSIVEGELSMGHARALLGSENIEQQQAVWQIILSKGLSVRQTEALIKKIKNQDKKQKGPNKNTEDVYYLNYAEELSRFYGTKVQIKRKGKKGKVEVEFYNDDDLDRLLSLMKTGN